MEERRRGASQASLMSRPTGVFTLLALTILVVPTLGIAGSEISHSPVACMALGDHPVVRAELAPGMSATSVRVYFHAARSSDEYFVEMRRGEGSKYQAVLPAPLDEGEAVRYSIVARRGSEQILRTQEYSARVSSGCTANLNDAERKASKNIVLGLTRGEQGDFLSGFSCKGIVAKISAAGELSSLYGCAEGAQARFGSPAPVVEASNAITASAMRASTSASGLLIGGTNTIGVTAGVLNTIPISSCRPR